MPRTPEEEATLVTVRPPGWEYLLFGAVILRRMSELEPKWRDHEIRYKSAPSNKLNAGEAREKMMGLSSSAQRVTHNFDRVFDPEVMISAFGEPGDAGDADRIVHLAERFVDVYNDFLDQAAELRSADVPAPFEPVFEVASRFNDQPIREIREFVETTISELDRVSPLPRADTGETITMKFELVLTMEDGLMEEFDQRMEEFDW